jgi:hypothetical protein
MADSNWETVVTGLAWTDGKVIELEYARTSFDVYRGTVPTKGKITVSERGPDTVITDDLGEIVIGPTRVGNEIEDSAISLDRGNRITYEGREMTLC